ncbi:MAG TPA: hypothetical protein VEA40_21005 [Ramlibacter sp.]|nr:hypothetical protein [Ramlibacter sp.]
MNDADLDGVYTALCHAMADVGEAHAQRFLAMLCLALLVRQEEPDEMLRLIDQVKARAIEP